MTLKLINTIAQRTTDRDGFSEADRREISGLGRTKPERAKIYKALDVFVDLIVTKQEFGKFVHQLKLNSNARSYLVGIIGHDGMGLLRKQFADNPGIAHAKLVDPKSSAKVREAAAAHIASSNDPAAKHILTNALKTERDWTVRFAIAKALIGVDSRTRKRPDVITVLVTAYRKGDDRVRAYVLSKLRDVQTRAVTDVFIDASTHRSPIIRSRSVGILAKLNDPKAKTAVLKALKDPDEGVRVEAIRALGQAKEVKAFYALIKASVDASDFEEKAIDVAIQKLSQDELVRTSTLIHLLTSPHADRRYVVRRLSLATGAAAQLVIAGMIKMLKHCDYLVRRSAAQVLSHFSGKAVVDAFASIVGSGDFVLRMRALVYLGERGDARAAMGLMKALKHTDGRVRAMAARAMCIRDKGVMGALIAALNDGNSDVRKAAVETLAHFDSPNAITERMRVAMNDVDASVRFAAIEGLKGVNDARLIPVFLKALKEPFDIIRSAALRSLGKFNDPRIVPAAIALLTDKSGGVRTVAVGLLGARNDRRATSALFEAFNTNRYDDVRIGIVKVLGKMKNPRVFRMLIVALGDWDLREAAAEALSRIKDPRFVPVLLAALKDRDWNVREAAAEASSRIKDPRVVPALIAALKDRNYVVRRAVAEALVSRIKDSRVVAAFIAALLAGDDDVWNTAAKAFGKLKDLRAVPALIVAFYRCKYQSDREAVLKVLQIIHPRTVSVLKATHRSIQRYKMSRLAEVLLGHYWTDGKKVKASKALDTLKGSPVVPALIPALKDSNPDIRLYAVRTLGVIRDRRAVPALIAVLKDVNSNNDMRSSAVMALGLIDDPRAVPALIAALTDNYLYTRMMASWALGKIGDDRARPFLIRRLVKEGDGSTRMAIARALGRIGGKRARRTLEKVLRNKSDNYHVRNAAWEALGKPGPGPRRSY